MSATNAGLLLQRELHHVIVASAEIVGAASEVMHIHVVGVFVGDGDGLLAARAQIVGPHVKRARVVQSQRLAVRKREAGVGGVARDYLGRAQLPARKNVLANKFGERNGLVVHHNASLAKFFDVWLHNGVQHHAAAARKQRERAREEGFVTLGAEMFKGANANDAVNGFGEFFPALQAKVNTVGKRVGGGILSGGGFCRGGRGGTMNGGVVVVVVVVIVIVVVVVVVCDRLRDERVLFFA